MSTRNEEVQAEEAEFREELEEIEATGGTNQRKRVRLIFGKKIFPKNIQIGETLTEHFRGLILVVELKQIQGEAVQIKCKTKCVNNMNE